MSRVPFEASRNRILALLPDCEGARICARLEAVELVTNAVVCEAGVRRTHAYFPIDAVVSIFAVSRDGAQVELATVGNDGMVGASLVLAGGASPVRTIVQCDGTALRMPAEDFELEFCASPKFRLLTRLYTQLLLTQVAQMAICNLHHTLDQRVCRWLLARIWRSGSARISITHQSLAAMLGVRREGVTIAVQKLQAAGLLVGNRGALEVIDRAGIESRCCECLELLLRESERLLPLGPRMQLSRVG